MKINLKNTILALAAFAMVGGVTAATLSLGNNNVAEVDAAGPVTFLAGTDTSSELTLSKSGITVTLSTGTLSRTDNYRVYAKGTMTISSILGNITAISFDGTDAASGKTPANLSTTVGTYSTSTYSWTGDSSSVVFSASSQAQIKSISVTYQAAVTPVPTSIDLVADDEITGGVKGAVTAEILYDVNYESTEGTYEVSFESSDESVAVISNVDSSTKTATVRFLDNCPTGVSITCTSDELDSVSATHTFYVTGLVDPTYITFEKVTEEPADWTGSYLFVYESGSLAFNGALNADQSSNTIDVAISDGAISMTDRAAAFTIAEVSGGVSIRAASGKYIGNGSDSNALTYSDSALTNTITFGTDGNVIVQSSGGAYLRYNATSGQDRFRYFKSSTYTAQKAIALYRAGTDDEIVVRNFVDNNMKFDVVPDLDNKGTGLCKTEGWYDSAVIEYNKLSEDQKELFVTSPWFTDAFNRLSSWAAANGDKFNASGEIVKAANTIIVGNNSENTIVLSAALILTVGALATGGMILLSKKRKRA